MADEVDPIDTDSAEPPDADRIRERGDAEAEMLGSVIITDRDGKIILTGPDAPQSPVSIAYDGEVEGVATGEDYTPPTTDEEDEE